MRFVLLFFCVTCLFLVSSAQESSRQGDSVVGDIDRQSDELAACVAERLQTLQNLMSDLQEQRYACLVKRKTHEKRPGGMVFPREYWIIGNEGPGQRFNARSTRKPSVSFDEAWYEQVIVGDQTNFRPFWVPSEKPERYSKDELRRKVLAIDPIKLSVQSASAINDHFDAKYGELPVWDLWNPVWQKRPLVVSSDSSGSLIARWQVPEQAKEDAPNRWQLTSFALFDAKAGFCPTEVQFLHEGNGIQRVYSRTVTQWKQIDRQWLPVKMTIHERTREHHLEFDWRFGDQLPSEPLVDRSRKDWRAPFYTLYDGAWDRSRNRKEKP